MCLDWLFNMQIPESSPRCVVIRPSVKTFVNGMAAAYSEDYDEELFKGHLTEFEFTKIMEKLNDQIGDQFPCAFCQIIGYVCCPMTLGASFLLPGQCVNDAEEFAH